MKITFVLFQKYVRKSPLWNKINIQQKLLEHKSLGQKLEQNPSITQSIRTKVGRTKYLKTKVL